MSSYHQLYHNNQTKLTNILQRLLSTGHSSAYYFFEHSTAVLCTSALPPVHQLYLPTHARLLQNPTPDSRSLLACFRLFLTATAILYPLQPSTMIPFSSHLLILATRQTIRSGIPFVISPYPRTLVFVELMLPSRGSVFRVNSYLIVVLFIYRMQWTFERCTTFASGVMQLYDRQRASYSDSTS